MEKNFDFVQKGYTADAVIARGYAVFDEWEEKNFSSRKIVDAIEHAIFAMKQNRTKLAGMEALSCLFALDLRVNKKYDTFLQRLFLYFSWRRETRAMMRLRSVFHFSIDEPDIRTVIEVELQRLREKLDGEESDDGDDETHGGKRNGKTEEEEVAAEEKGQEQAPEEKAEEVKDTSEEKTEDLSEETTMEEPTKESGEPEKNAEHSQEEPDITVQDLKEEGKQEEHNELKEENNGSDERSEPSHDKPKEAKSYNDAVDVPPIYEERADREQTEDKTSFIDEMILDQMVKGDKNVIGYTKIDGFDQSKEADLPQDTATQRNEESDHSEKDAYLYENTFANDEGEAWQSEKIDATEQPEKASEGKTEQSKETIQPNDNTKTDGQEANSRSERIQVDLNASFENQVIKELNDTMSDESRVAFSQMQMDAAREKLTILYSELGIEEPVEVIGRQEPTQVSRQSIAPNRK